MNVGLRTTGKPVDKPPNPEATAPRFYSTRMVALGGPPILKISFQQLIDQFPVVLPDFIVYV